MRTIRSFVAVPLADGVRRSTIRVMQQIKEDNDGIRWVPADSFHLTLKFLGDVENSEVPAVCDVIRDVCAEIEPFELDFAGIGASPSLDKARVINAGVQDPSGNLTRLAMDLEKALAKLGFKPEPRDYRPHLTLGRTRRGYKSAGDAVIQRIRQHADVRLGGMTADQVLLIASFLDKGGPTYQVMDTIELGE